MREENVSPFTGLSKHESDFHADLVLRDLAVFHDGFLILNPGAFYLLQSGIGTRDSVFECSVEALSRRRDNLDGLCNGHGWEVSLKPILVTDYPDSSPLSPAYRSR